MGLGEIARAAALTKSNKDKISAAETMIETILSKNKQTSPNNEK